MEPELDYEPENLDESNDPFTSNLDDNSELEHGAKSGCEDNLYGDFDVHENAEKLDDEITYDHSVNFDPVKTDLISPVDRMFEEDLHGKQSSEGNSQTLDEEFYIGKNSLGNNSDLDNSRKDNERSYYSSDETVSTKRTRSREVSESKDDRDHSRKRRTSPPQHNDDDDMMPKDGSSKKRRSSSNEGERNREDRSKSSDKNDSSNTSSKHEPITRPGNSPEPVDDLKHESVRAEAERDLWLKDLFKGARFFMIKSRNDHNITLAKEKNVWSTTPNNEPRLNKAFSNTRCVILLFSGAESQRFAGFARLASESSTEIPMPPWQIPPGMSIRALSGVFQLEWITKEELMFTKTTHLYNEWNLRKPVKIGRDGQEIEPGCAEKLCRLFDFSTDIDIYQIVKRIRAQEKIRSNRESDSGGRNREFDSRQTFPRHIHNRDHYGGDSRGYGGNNFYNRDRRGRSRSPFRGNGRPRSPYRGYNSGYYSRGGGYRYDYNNRNNYNQSTALGSASNNRSYGAEKGDEASCSSHKPNNEQSVAAGNTILDPCGEVSRETMLHGSYGDYMREFQKQMQRVYPGFPGPFPPPFMGMQFYPPFGMPPPLVATATLPQQSSSSSSRMDDIDTHAKLVDKFLRKTRRRSDSSASRSQSRSRSRSKSRSGYDDGNYASEDGRAADSYSDSNSVDYHDSESRRRRSSDDRSRRYEYISNRTRRSSSGNSDDREIQYSSKSAQRRY